MIRCSYCCRFMGEGYVCTPWGSYHSDEPPDSEYVCEKCFTPERKTLLDRMWQPPIKLIKLPNPIFDYWDRNWEGK